MILVESALEVRSVLLATDFSQASENPLRQALAIARCYRAKFCLAHVVCSLPLTMAGPDAITASVEAVLRDAAQLEDDLVKNGALTGLQHQFIVRQGEVWPELQAIIREEKVDLVVVGTHGRDGFGRLLLGSVAEQVFRQADCIVATVGPGSYEDVRVGSPRVNRTFLFATDFGEASLRALPLAISCANQFGAKLVLLNVIDQCRMHESEAREASVRRLAELTRGAALKVRPEFVAELGTATSMSERILDTADKFSVELIIMGLHDSKHIGTASHMRRTTAYEVVCCASCPVVTVR